MHVGSIATPFIKISAYLEEKRKRLKFWTMGQPLDVDRIMGEPARISTTFTKICTLCSSETPLSKSTRCLVASHFQDGWTFPLNYHNVYFFFGVLSASSAGASSAPPPPSAGAGAGAGASSAAAGAASGAATWLLSVEAAASPAPVAPPEPDADESVPSEWPFCFCVFSGQSLMRCSSDRQLWHLFGMTPLSQRAATWLANSPQL